MSENQQLNIADGTVNILMEVGGDLYLVATDKEHLEAIEFLVKRSTKNLVPTSRTQMDLVNFLNIRINTNAQ